MLATRAWRIVIPVVMRALFGESLVAEHVAGRVSFFLAACRQGSPEAAGIEP